MQASDEGECFFLLQAVGLLKDGGVLVYSTCTITPQENEEQVAWALKSFPCLKLAGQVSKNLIELFALLKAATQERGLGIFNEGFTGYHVIVL